MGLFSKQMTRNSHLLSGILILAILLFSAAGANAGSVITLCNDCHGMPPKDAARKGNPHFRSNSSATVGSHQKHLVVSPVANDCVVCHGTVITATGHQNDIINMAASISGGSYGKGLFFNQTSIPVLNATATCSSVSCHANVYGPGSVTTPQWGSTAANCTACHTTPIATTGPATGSHAIHANPSCIACHNAGTTSTTVPSTGHADGNIDVTNGYPLNVVKHAAGTYTGTCSASTCHGQGAPTWGATSVSPVNGFPYSAAQCGKCHSQGGTVTAGAPFYSTAIPKVTLNTDAKVGAHTAHLTSVDSLHPAFACSDCHGTVNLNKASHMNGFTNFSWSVLAKTGNLTPSYSGGICSNVYCHGGHMPGGDTSGSNRTPTWANPNYLPANLTVAGCGTCHGFPPLSATHSTVTLPVGFPSATVPIGTTCNCHGNINPAGNSYATIFVNYTLHINGTLEGGKCDACHGYPPASFGFKGTQNNWSSARTEDYLGGGGTHTINNHVSKTAKPSDGFAYCNKCHSPADHATSPTVFTPSKNIKVRVNQRYRLESAKQFKYTSNRLDGILHKTGTCLNSSCHFGATPKWDPSN